MEAKMKRSMICRLIIVILVGYFVSACSPGVSTSDQPNCSSGGEVCIYLTVAEPIQISKPLNIAIKVTSKKDISDLNVTLHTPSEVTVDGPKNWESNLTFTSIQPGLTSWNFDIKAGQTLTFNRVLHFSQNDGYFYIGAGFIAFNGTLTGIDSFNLQITKGGGVVYREATSIPPYSPNITSAVYGPGTPAPAFLLPSSTPNRTTSINTPTQFVPLVATSTPRTSPYPPPPYP